MKSIQRILLIILGLALLPFGRPAKAQIHAQYNFVDFTSQPQGVKRLTITPLLAYTVNSTNIVTGDRIVKTSNAGGSIIVSNMIPGSYRVELAGSFTATVFTNNFGTNVSGLVNAKDYLGTSTNLGGLIYAYSQAEADGRFITNPPSPTAAQVLTWNGSAWLPSDIPAGAGGSVTNEADPLSLKTNAGTAYKSTLKNINQMTFAGGWQIYTNTAQNGLLLTNTIDGKQFTFGIGSGGATLSLDDLNASDSITAGLFNGNGSLLTALSAGNLTGTLPNATFPAVLPAVDGSQLTGITAGGSTNAIAPTNGTGTFTRLNFPVLIQAGGWTTTTNASGDLVDTNSNGSAFVRHRDGSIEAISTAAGPSEFPNGIVASEFIGDGSGLTNLLYYDTLILSNSTTATIQAAVTRGGIIKFQKGVYANLTNIVVNPSADIELDGGGVAELQFSTSTTNFLFDTGTNGLAGRFLFHGFVVNGQKFPSYDSSAFSTTSDPGNPEPHYNQSWTNRGGLRINGAGGGLIYNNVFKGFAGAGVMLFNTGGQSAHAGQRVDFMNNICYSNFIGAFAMAWVYDYSNYFNADPITLDAAKFSAEYTLISGNQFFRNQYGLVSSAGNVNVSGNTFTDNQRGLVGSAGDNVCHAIYHGNIGNHNVIGTWFMGVPVGQISGNMFRANTVNLIANNCTELTFMGNSMSGGSIIATNGTTGTIRNNNFTGNWGSDFTTNIASGVMVTANYSANGTDDGYPLTGPSFISRGTITGNGSGLTNIPVSSVVINTNAAPATNTIVGFFWITNGANVYKIPVLK